MIERNFRINTSTEVCAKFKNRKARSYETGISSQHDLQIWYKTGFKMPAGFFFHGNWKLRFHFQCDRVTSYWTNLPTALWTLDKIQNTTFWCRRLSVGKQMLEMWAAQFRSFEPKGRSPSIPHWADKTPASFWPEELGERLGKIASGKYRGILGGEQW